MPERSMAETAGGIVGAIVGVVILGAAAGLAWAVARWVAGALS